MCKKIHKFSVFCTEKWINLLNGTLMLLFQLLFFLVEKENTILQHDGGKSNIWILDKHSFSNRLLNEACGILLFVNR